MMFKNVWQVLNLVKLLESPLFLFMHEFVSDDRRVLIYTYALFGDIHVGLNSGTVPAVLGHLATTCVNVCSDNIILLIF